MIAPMTIRESAVRGVKVVELRHASDAVRGDLAVIEFAEALPFKRVAPTAGGCGRQSAACTLPPAPWPCCSMWRTPSTTCSC